MGVLNMAQNAWRALSPEKREELLRGLAGTTKGYDPKTFWGGQSFGDLAKIDDYDDLPSDLCGRLICALTNSGFSIEENQRMEAMR